MIGGGSHSIPRAFAARNAGPVTVAEIDRAVTDVAAREFWFDPESDEILHMDAGPRWPVGPCATAWSSAMRSPTSRCRRI